MENSNYRIECSRNSSYIQSYQSSTDTIFCTNEDDYGCVFDNNSNTDKYPCDYFSHTADNTEMILDIVYSDINYEGKLPEYSRDIRNTIKLLVKDDLEKTLSKFSEDNMKKAIFELVITAKKEDIKKTSEDKTLNSDLKNLKKSVFEDELAAIEDKYKHSGLQEASWLEKTIEKIPIIASSINEDWKGVSDIASKVVDLAVNSNRTKFNKPEQRQVPLNENQEIQPNKNIDPVMANFNAEMAELSFKLKNGDNLDKASKEIEQKYINDSTRFKPDIIKTPNLSLEERSINLQYELSKVIEETELNTPELQAAFYKLEESSCSEYLKKVEKEINNRNNKARKDEEFAHLTNEELLKYKRILKNDEKIIHSLYRSIVPSWFEANSDAIQEILISAALQIAQHSGKDEKYKNYIKVLEIKW